jgi:hypothetical protein
MLEIAKDPVAAGDGAEPGNVYRLAADDAPGNSPNHQLELLADRIRSAHRNAVAAIIEIGYALLEAKRLLGHGKFLPWLAAEFTWSGSTANRFMAVANCFGGKSVTVKDLGLASIYALAAKSTPPAIRNEVVQRLEAGQLVDRDYVRNRIFEAKQVAAQVKEEAARSPAARKARAARKAKKDEQLRRDDALQAERWRRKRQAGQAAADFLRTCLDSESFDRFGAMLCDADLHAFRDRLQATAQAFQDAGGAE